MINTITIATRQSEMALYQASAIQQRLADLFPQIDFIIKGMSTSGDRNLSKPLAQIGGKGVFVKELQRALLNGEADCAVHCVKDMSVYPIPGLTIAAILDRDDPRDALVSTKNNTIATLPPKAIVGTGSPRRGALLKKIRPDLDIKSIRGNVNTRLDKLVSGEYDALILAASGLKRLQLTQYIQEYLDPDHFVPATGQGALCIECRSDNPALYAILNALNNTRTQLCISAEQTIIKSLNGDCTSAIGAYAQIRDNSLTLNTIVLSSDGQQCVSALGTCSPDNVQTLGGDLAQQLIEDGALALLQQ